MKPGEPRGAADRSCAATSRHATRIRAKRNAVVAEVPDWEELRAAGEAIKRGAMRRLDVLLEELEAAVQAAGGHVHWARDATEANAVVGDLVAAHDAREVVKVKSLTTDEIEPQPGARAARGDGDRDRPRGADRAALATTGRRTSSCPRSTATGPRSATCSPRELGLQGLGDEPEELTDAARRHLRQGFLRARVGVSGANFGIAETGTVCVVESEGNGRMCTTLPQVLITVMGIEKVLPDGATSRSSCSSCPAPRPASA